MSSARLCRRSGTGAVTAAPAAEIPSLSGLPEELGRLIPPSAQLQPCLGTGEGMELHGEGQWSEEGTAASLVLLSVPPALPL